MINLVNIFNRLSPLDTDASEALRAVMANRKFAKGEQLLRAGDTCRFVYCVETGLAKTYFTSESKEFIMRFFPEGSLFTVVDSFALRQPSNYSIMALEDMQVSKVSYPDLTSLAERFHSIETAYRHLLTIASANMMKRISEMLEENASQRYQRFLTDHGPLMQRISLGDLANYLGITQVSLSRIRAAR